MLPANKLDKEELNIIKEGSIEEQGVGKSQRRERINTKNYASTTAVEKKTRGDGTSGTACTRLSAVTEVARIPVDPV